jgi:hypothetical protein
MVEHRISSTTASAPGRIGTMIAALDHPSISEGPGGPAETVPGQHHVRMNRYIARSEGGTFTVVENLGRIDPKENARLRPPDR